MLRQPKAARSTLSTRRPPPPFRRAAICLAAAAPDTNSRLRSSHAPAAVFACLAARNVFQPSSRPTVPDNERDGARASSGNALTCSGAGRGAQLKYVSSRSPSDTSRRQAGQHGTPATCDCTFMLPPLSSLKPSARELQLPARAPARPCGSESKIRAQSGAGAAAKPAAPLSHANNTGNHAWLTPSLFPPSHCHAGPRSRPAPRSVSREG